MDTLSAPVIGNTVLPITGPTHQPNLSIACFARQSQQGGPDRPEWPQNARRRDSEGAVTVLVSITILLPQPARLRPQDLGGQAQRKLCVGRAQAGPAEGAPPV